MRSYRLFVLPVGKNSFGFLLVCLLIWVDMVEGCCSYLWLDTAPVLAFDCAVGVFSPCSNMTL